MIIPTVRVVIGQDDGGRVGQADHENLESFLERIAPLGAPASEARAGRDIVILMFAGPAMKAGVRWRGPAG